MKLTPVRYLLCAIAVVICFTAFRPYDGHVSAIDKDRLLAIAITDAEKIPLYPGATDVQTDGKWLDIWHKTTFLTSDEPRAVVAYYRKVLTQKGWRLSSPPDSEDIYPSYRWIDSTGVTPWSLYLSINTDAPVGGRSSISMLQRRVPDQQKIPLFPGGHQVDTTYFKDPEHGYPVKVISYSAPAEPTLVENYYMDVLVQHGWWLEEQASEDSFDTGMDFIYGLNDWSGIEGATVRVIVKPGHGGETHVELRIHGTNIDMP
jgi:hypothetical protein